SLTIGCWGVATSAQFFLCHLWISSLVLHPKGRSQQRQHVPPSGPTSTN
uniref:Uncharacterized protein n=1 Tax=Anabas testudineus TaxID=64144 RepID=A0A7N6A306_ANATE